MKTRWSKSHTPFVHLEFEDQRPFYDWLLERLAEAGLLAHPLPKQYEFARLNLTYVVLSKRKLIQLVEEKHVSGWDDPRLPTLAGARRRGYVAEGFKLFTDRIGVSKADSWIDYSTFEDCMREVLNINAERRIAVLDPIKLVIDNYPEGQSRRLLCTKPSAKTRTWQTRSTAYPRTMDRTRRLYGSAKQRLFQIRARRYGALALRLCGEMHRL